MKRVQLPGLRIIFYWALAIALVFTACKKGDTGPEGPAGPQGNAGPPGPKGDTGVANVIYSNWLDVSFDPLTTGGGDTVAFDATILAPKLTADVINKGDVKVYFNANIATDPFIWPLPITDLFAFTSILNLNVAFSVGEIYMYSDTDASSFTTTQNQKAWQFRYIIIPGGRPARSAIDWNNYEQVKNYLGLKD